MFVAGSNERKSARQKQKRMKSGKRRMKPGKLCAMRKEALENKQKFWPQPNKKTPSNPGGSRGGKQTSG